MDTDQTLSTIATTPTKYNINDYDAECLIGKSKKALVKSNQEVGIFSYRAGDVVWPYMYQDVSKIHLCVSGRCEFVVQQNNSDISPTNYRIKKDEILVVPPGWVTKFIALTDCTVVCIKNKAEHNEKIEFSPLF